MTVTLDTETIRLMTLFENVTGAGVKDCLVDDKNDTVYFVIHEGDIARAIGKNGSSVKNTENLIRKDVRVFEFSDDIEKFVRNLIPQTGAVKVNNENGAVEIDVWVNKKDKASVIGRDGRNLKIYKEFLERHHGIGGIKIR